MALRGIAKGNTIVLDNGAALPEGAAVEVRILARSVPTPDSVIPDAPPFGGSTRPPTDGDEVVGDARPDAEARWLAIAQTFADAVPADMTDEELELLIDKTVVEVRQDRYDRDQVGQNRGAR